MAALVGWLLRRITSQSVEASQLYGLVIVSILAGATYSNYGFTRVFAASIFLSIFAYFTLYIIQHIVEKWMQRDQSTL
jgi:uncharacterized membrane protein YoaK (UPF0700 family)